MVPLAWFGSCAIGHREPCQVRKEAAISGSSYVPQISLLLRLRSFQRAISAFIWRKSMYTALYRACRPEIFDEILGQEHIVRILKNQINTDSTSHAYLFCGTRGTGKTTTARILAKGLNCLSEGEKPCGRCSACREICDGVFIDVVEIDAASNNGVDNIRELRESVKYPPAVGRKKVYIIDEVHMLSSGAFNALLKTLEEPPEYVVFILATTEPQKLPATILSRCMRLDFKRVPEAVLIRGMAEICAGRGIHVEEDALKIIAANADGSVRDGLSILDQCISGGDMHITAADVLDFLGASGEEVFIELTDMVRMRKTADALILLDKVLSDGKDVRQFMKDWVSHYRNLLMTKFIKDPQNIINMSVENIDRIRKQSNSMEPSDISRGILEISRTMNDAKWSTQPRILLELVIVKLSTETSSAGVQQMQAMQPIQRGAAPGRTAPGRAESLHGKPGEGNPQVIHDDGSPERTRTLESDDGLHEKVSAEGIQRAGALENADMLLKGAAPENADIPQSGSSNRNADGIYDADMIRDVDSLQNTGIYSSDGISQPGAKPATLEDDKGYGFAGENTFDLEEIWNAVFEDGEAAKGSFYMIGSSGRLVEVDENSFTVEMSSETKKELAEKSRSLLEDLMEKHTGVRRMLKLVTAGAGMRSSEGRSVEEIARDAEALLGIDIEIQ